MESAKKQHYVPRFYLRRFTCDGSHLFDCDTFDGRSYGTRVEDVASARYFNDAPLDSEISSPGDRDPQQTLEQHLSRLEGSAATAIGTLVEGIEDSNEVNPLLRPEIARFIAVQVLRTQEARTSIEQIWERGLAALRSERLAPELDRWLAEADRPDGAAITQAHLLLDSSLLQTVVDALLAHIWFVGVNGTGTPLWTSGHPVVRRAHVQHPLMGTSGLASPGIEIDLPLSPTIVLILAERTCHAPIAPLDGRVISLVPDTIVYLNALQASQCYRYVYAPSDDFALLQQLRQERPELFRPDRDRVEVVAPKWRSGGPARSNWARVSRAIKRLAARMSPRLPPRR